MQALVLRDRKLVNAWQRIFVLEAGMLEYDEISSMSLSDGCWYCKKKEADTWDHIVPRKLGGVGVIENLVPCCQSCNSMKGFKPLWKFRRYQEKLGRPHSFDTPMPESIPGRLIWKGIECMGFESNDGSLKIDRSEYHNRIYVNET